LDEQEKRDEIGEYQPFMASMMLGFNHDLNPSASEEVIAVCLLVWAFFREFPGAKAKYITVDDFEKVMFRNFELMKYLGGEKNPGDFDRTISVDLNKMRSQDLFAAVVLRFDTRSPLVSMSIEEKDYVLLGVKTLIESIEETLN
jgi:hypothetical protein